MAEGQEQLRIEIKDLDFDSFSDYTGEILMIALDEDEGFEGIRIDIEGVIDTSRKTKGALKGASFWIEKKKFPELFKALKEHVIPAVLAESKKPGFEKKYKIIKKE